MDNIGVYITLATFTTFMCIVGYLLFHARREISRPAPEPTTDYSFFQAGTGWLLVVKVYRPDSGEFGWSYSSIVSKQFHWAELPTKAQIDAKIIELTLDVWEAYDVYLYANGLPPRVVE